MPSFGHLGWPRQKQERSCQYAPQSDGSELWQRFRLRRSDSRANEGDWAAQQRCLSFEVPPRTQWHLTHGAWLSSSLQRQVLGILGKWPQPLLQGPWEN